MYNARKEGCYTAMQVTQWDFQNRRKSGWTGTSSFVLELPLCNLCRSIIDSVPFDQITLRAYYVHSNKMNLLHGPRKKLAVS